MADTTKKNPLAGKVNKKMVPVIGAVLIGGMIVAFMVKYGATGEGAKKASEERAKMESVAAQGGGTVVTQDQAKASISSLFEEEKKKKAEADALAAQVAKKAVPASDYPDSKIPFDGPGSLSLDEYARAKAAIAADGSPVMGQVAVNGLPEAFDEADQNKSGSQNVANNAPAGSPLLPEWMRAGQTQAPPPPQQGNQSATTGGEHNEAWQAQKAKQAAALSESPVIRPQAATSRYVLQEGAVIQAVMMTALNSQLPGHVSARVTQDVYDSIRGTKLIIPAGSRLEGEYNSDVKFGQDRVFMGFNRIILPSGSSIQISAWKSSDAIGRSGVGGRVNNHILPTLGYGILLATIGNVLQPKTAVAPSLSLPGQSPSIGDAAGQVVSTTANNILGKYQNMKPEITLYAGQKVSLIVAQDIEVPAQAHGVPAN